MTQASTLTNIKSLFIKAKRDEKGVAMVEFALVTPFLLAIIAGIIDFGSLFFLQNNMHATARESARSLATQSVTVDEAKTMATSRLSGWGNTFTVTATEPDPANPAETDVVVRISVPMADVAPLGLISFSGSIQTQVTMRQEG